MRRLIAVLVLVFICAAFVVAKTRADETWYTSDQRIEVDGGKLELINGFCTVRKRDAYTDFSTGKTVPAAYTCFARVSVVNHTNKKYKVTPFVNFYDKQDFKLYETKPGETFSSKTLKPRGRHQFQASFELNGYVAKETKKAVITLSHINLGTYYRDTGRQIIFKDQKKKR